MQPGSVWVSLSDALAVIAGRKDGDLDGAAERFRAAAYDGEFEVRARPHLFADDKLVIPRECWAPWRAVCVPFPGRKGKRLIGFYFGVRADWFDGEVRVADIDRLWPVARPPSRAVKRRAAVKKLLLAGYNPPATVSWKEFEKELGKLLPGDAPSRTHLWRLVTEARAQLR